MQIDSCFLCGDLSDRGGRVRLGQNLGITSDIAPIHPGHMLLHALDHQNGFADLDAAQLRSLSGVLANLFATPPLAGQRVLLFEHGTDARDNVAIGCTDHAHIHVLPVGSEFPPPEKLVQLLASNYGVADPIPLAELGEWHGQDYFWVSDQSLRLFRLLPPQTDRQVLRRLVCEALGRSNYQTWNLLDLVAAQASFRDFQERGAGTIVTDETVRPTSC